MGTNSGLAAEATGVVDDIVANSDLAAGPAEVVGTEFTMNADADRVYAGGTTLDAARLQI